MYQLSTQHERVLRVFRQRDIERLTASYLAYELDMTAGGAEELLDAMVKHSLLELDFDEQGQLYYTLSDELQFHPQYQQRSQPRRAPQAPGTQRRADHGFDGAVGHGAAPGGGATRSATRPRPQPSRDADGCDGTVGHPSSSRGAQSWDAGEEARRRVATAPRARQAPSDPRVQPADGDPAGGAMVRTRRDNLPARYSGNANPMIAALLSVLFVGLGQVYNREVGKGIGMLAATVLLWSISFSWVLSLGLIVQVWSAVDAYSVASQRNDADAEDDAPTR